MYSNKAKKAAKERQILAALSEHFKVSDVLTLNGVAMTVQALTSVLQAHLDAESAAEAVKAKWQTAVATANEKGAAVTGVLPALRAALVSAYGGKSQIVADFGFTPKTRKTTIAAQATGIERRKQTRAAHAAPAPAPTPTHPASS